MSHLSCTWNRGLLLASHDESRWIQLTVGKGSDRRRLLYGSGRRHVSIRIWRHWWLSLGWKRAAQC